ncbi:MAG: hypothetical protein RR588_03040 [Solibacillus sp.]
MYNRTIMRDLGALSQEARDLMDERKIEFNKAFSKLTNESNKEAKEERCYICKKDCSSFCNSHTVPASFLRNVDVNGDVYTNGKLINVPLLPSEKGVNKSGTFRIICNDCDSKKFSEYENADNYSTFPIPTPKMIAQIAMKTALNRIAKRKFEIALYGNVPLGNESVYRQQISDMDLKEYIDDFNYAKKAAEKDDDGKYNILYYKVLDYVVPIAFQSSIALVTDLDGALINNVYSTKPEYRIKSIDVCVFPLEETSIIIIFAKSKDKIFRNFRKQINKLSIDEQLAAINYMIFSYSEDVFLSKEIDENILLDEALIAASRKSLEVFVTSAGQIDMEVVKESYSFSKMNDVPNLLSSEYRIR